MAAFAIAVLTGILAGFIASKIPVIGLPLAIGAPIVLALRAIRTADRARRLAELAGVLLGSGGIFLVGALNTIAACQETEDFCGNANVTPLLALALGMTVLGVASSAGALMEHRSQR